MSRSVSILGSTGSIGCNTVDLIRRQPEGAIAVEALTGSANVDLLARQARELRARIAVTADPRFHEDLKQRLAGTGIEAAAGSRALVEAAARPVDWGMSAIVGAAGLAPTLELARHGGVLALANKESMVCAGELVKATCARHSTELVPVDSEHSAIFQALAGNRVEDVSRILLTASGGPFRTWTSEQMAKASVEQAVAHPNWSMGRRISIDSASMFNKALEVIEAQQLFSVRPDQIEIAVHPQSIVHSMVEYVDGSILAQLGVPDMRGAIGYALNWPARAPLPVDRLDFKSLARLDFLAPDPERFPALRLAYQAMETGGLCGAAFNAAKEKALDGFIEGRISFPDMARLVESVLVTMNSSVNGQSSLSGLQAVLEVDRKARAFGQAWIERNA